MRILVTGGAGFIGSAFVKLALKNSTALGTVSKVTVLDALTYSGNLENLAEVSDDPRLHVEVGNINDTKLLRQCLKSQDIVFNFAAESHVDRSISDAGIFVESNALGALHVFDESLKMKISKIIHISTDEVYGSKNYGKFKESANLQPNSPYSASKAASDLIARSFFKTHGLPVIITRSSNNYGPFQNTEKFIPLVITNLLNKKAIPIYGTGKNEREWIHVDDNCMAIALVASKGENGNIYNIGATNRFKNIEVARYIAKVMGHSEAPIDYVIDRQGHDFRYAINSRKLSKLGFTETKTFKKGISDTIEWYEKNKKWWENKV